MRQGPPTADEMAHAIALARGLGVDDPDENQIRRVVEGMRLYAASRQRARKSMQERERLGRDERLRRQG